VFRVNHPDRKHKMTPVRQEDTKMKIHELKENEMEQVCGGSFFTDWRDVPQRIGTESAEPENPGFPHLPVDWIAHGKC
jgi:hypothetical protein